MANANEYPIYDSTLFSTSNYVQEEQREEQELSSFTLAVTHLFGPEEARLSEKIWLDELESMDSPPFSADRNLRGVTIAASFRLMAERDSVMLPPLK